MHRVAVLIFCFTLPWFGCAWAVNDGGPAFTENKGQWSQEVLYKSALQGGYAYLERDGFTIQMLENNFYNHLHDWVQGKDSLGVSPTHTVKFKFKGASLLALSPILGEDIGRCENYFIGSDSARWSSNVRTYDRIQIPEIYPGIAASYGSNSGNLKYDFIVNPGSDPNQIAVEISGANSIFIREGRLHIQTSVGELQEFEPYSYQESDGRIQAVACHYVLNENVISYSFPEGYDLSKTLIIDPELEFSTFVGSASSNFGFTATYDAEGHLYGGAIVFGSFYPTTAGAAQIFYGGGAIDCGITKFSPDGASLIYSTYIGGSGNESPHSIVVNNANELYILGSTGSSNFPITAGAYQNSYGGGTLVAGAGFSYATGSDIFVTKLSANGQNIANSTYVGGSGNDGIDADSPLEQNYGDRFRGEIIVDAAGAAYIASTTTSPNFPTVNGYATNFSGNTSGVVFKLSANLQNMVWSTFTGGSNVEAAFGVQLASDNTVYFTGGTLSTNMPTTAGVIQGSKFLGVDGFIGRLSATGALLALTYNGTNGFDQNYFVQIDPAGNVYVIGQTTGTYPVTAGVYSNPQAKQYIHKMSADLTTTIWSTVIGAGTSINISPSAFLVSDCGQIYLSGWGGNLNNAGGTTNGLPITPDAYQSTTDGNDFYLAVLDTDAQSLEYGTFFGGASIGEHVDGGTSRFDKDGTIYQAVCAGCGGSNDFPTQPGVWSQTNPSTNCNLGVFKFSLGSVDAIAQIQAPNVVCPGTEFTVNNLSVGADQFSWTLGDGTTSTATTISHSYAEPGTYNITLTAEDSEGCLSPDAVTITIEVSQPPAISIAPVNVICAGDLLQLIASGETQTWQWLQPNLVSNAGVANPFFTGQGSATLQVVGANACGVDTASIDVIVGSTDIDITEDTDICPGESIALSASGGNSYEWSPAGSLQGANTSNPTATPDITTTYSVEITTADGCNTTESVIVTVLPPAPTLTGIDRYISCSGAAVVLAISGADSYSWSPAAGLSNPSVANPFANPGVTIAYTVIGTNECGSDEMTIDVILSEISLSLTADSVVCYKQPFAVSGSGAQDYRWQPAHLFTNSRAATTEAIIDQNTTITLTGTNSDGCPDTEQFTVVMYPRETVWAGRDRVISFGEEVTMESFSPYPISWQESAWLSCFICNNPIANPPETTEFYAEIVSSYNCTEVDTSTVFVRGNLYVPNAFSPDGDGLNDLFKAKGIDITDFKMEIFDRWGDLIFVSNDISVGWNGASKNDDYFSPPDVYPYRIVAKERYGELFELKGFIMLLR